MLEVAHRRRTKVFVAGHQGMVGSALVKVLGMMPDVDLCLRDRQELDLLDLDAVADWFQRERPDQVYLAAAKVGGISANSRFPADFIYENLSIQNNVIYSALKSGVKKLLFLGSSCIYPRMSEQPIKEESLLTGALESTNEPYAVAKIAGIKLCESLNRQYRVEFRSVMPTNLYGPNDNFHPQNSHVIPAMMNRFHDAKVQNQKEVVVWGSGKPKREFMHCDDMAAACVHVMNASEVEFQKVVPDLMCSHINIGTNSDVSIRELAEIMAKVTGYTGKILFDTSKPDGTPRKLLSVERLSQLGWRHSIGLVEGLTQTYTWLQENLPNVRSR